MFRSIKKHRPDWIDWIYFTKYPEDIPDYVKQSFPEGYTWERIMKFEVGVECTVSNDSRYIENIVTVFFRLSALGAY